ncbi:MAG: GIY-YIG nuclease family protein [Chitinophagales bacterium]
MRSIRELAKKFNCNPFELNKLLLKWEMPIQTTFGVDDGLISEDLAEHIDEQTKYLSDKSKTHNDIISLKRNGVVLDCKGTYVYFLIKNDLVVYVGQTVNLMERVGNHVKGSKDFNFITYIEVPKRWLLRTESHYIMQLNPHYNISGSNSIVFFESILRSFNG